MFRSCMMALILVMPRALQAQTSDSTPLARRAKQMGAIVNGAPFDADTTFSPSFLAQISAAKLTAFVARLHAQYGNVQDITAAGPATPYSGGFEVTFDKGYRLTMSLGIDTGRSHLVVALVFGAATRQIANLDGVMDAFRQLPGRVSVLAARVDDGTIVPMAAVDSDSALAIGSTFKLYIFAELLREIDAGARHWPEVVTVQHDMRSLPSGVLQSWPGGAPVTLQTLATLMISQSDNTAADQLLRVVGRDRVERIQTAAGNTHADRNVPFLTTREMFALKTPADPAALAEYPAATVPRRRGLLMHADSMSYDAIAPAFGVRPVAIGSVEWFASASDLARALVWIRDHSARGAGTVARSVLAVNPGLTWSTDHWSYIGYKGGSEPGVLAMAFLLQRKDGQWFVLTAAWNNPAADVDEAAFAALTMRAGELLAGR